MEIGKGKKHFRLFPFISIRFYVGVKFSFFFDEMFVLVCLLIVLVRINPFSRMHLLIFFHTLHTFLFTSLLVSSKFTVAVMRYDVMVLFLLLSLYPVTQSFPLFIILFIYVMLYNSLRVMICLMKMLPVS